MVLYQNARTMASVRPRGRYTTNMALSCGTQQCRVPAGGKPFLHCPMSFASATWYSSIYHIRNVLRRTRSCKVSFIAKKLLTGSGVRPVGPSESGEAQPKDLPHYVPTDSGRFRMCQSSGRLGARLKPLMECQELERRRAIPVA
jgi:hypothetical protein